MRSPFQEPPELRGRRASRLWQDTWLSNWRGDVTGGLTTAVVALPLAMAFGATSGAGAIAGLWGAIALGLIAAPLGGTPAQVSGPTGPMTVIMAGIIATMVQRYGPGAGLALAFTVALVAGLFQVVFGLLRLGQYIVQMPYSVISGFMSGIGGIVLVLQLPVLMGLDLGGSVPGILSGIGQEITNFNPFALLIGALTFAVVRLYPKRFNSVLPSPLVALVGVTALSLLLPIDALPRLGAIPQGFPQLQLPQLAFGDLRMLGGYALTLAVLGSIDSLLTSLVADNITRTQHNSDRELIGQGLGNMGAALLGGLPGAGATMGTVVNIQSGGRSALSGIFRAVILMLVILVGAPLAAEIPQAVLAGIALKVGVDIVDWDFIKRAHRISLNGALIMYLVIALTVLVDLITAVFVGVFIANILTIDKMSALQSQAIQSVSTGDGDLEISDDERELLNQGEGKVLLFQLNGAMIFGVAKAINREHNAISDCRAVVFDLSKVSHLGVTAALAVENAVEEAIEVGRQVFVVGASGTTRRRLEKLGLFNKLPTERTEIDRREALRTAVMGMT